MLRLQGEVTRLSKSGAAEPRESVRLSLPEPWKNESADSFPLSLCRMKRRSESGIERSSTVWQKRSSEERCRLVYSSSIDPRDYG